MIIFSSIFRKRYDVYKIISRIITKAAQFETHTKKDPQKIQPFLEVCNISYVAPPSDVEQTTPLSPKRESPTGKQQKIHE